MFLPRFLKPKPTFPSEFTSVDRDVFDYVAGHRLSLAPAVRLIAVINACKQALLLQGDFLECGVGRGGNALAAKMTFERYGSNRCVWLVDDFPPDDANSSVVHAAFTRGAKGGRHAKPSAGDIRLSFRKASVAMAQVRFVDCEPDRLAQADWPNKLSVLSIAGDDYESTRAQLEIFYPRLVPGGSLIIQDCGPHHETRQAADDYFEQVPPPPLHEIDPCARLGIKAPGGPSHGLAAFSQSFRVRPKG